VGWDLEGVVMLVKCLDDVDVEVLMLSGCLVGGGYVLQCLL